MNGTIKTRMGKLMIEVQFDVAESDVAKLIERSVKLALPAQLQAKAAGGRIADMDTLTESAFLDRFAKRDAGDTKVIFSSPSIEPWTPSAKPLSAEGVTAALKSGKLELTAEQKAELAALLAA